MANVEEELQRVSKMEFNSTPTNCPNYSQLDIALLRLLGNRDTVCVGGSTYKYPSINGLGSGMDAVLVGEENIQIDIAPTEPFYTRAGLLEFHNKLFEGIGRLHSDEVTELSSKFWGIVPSLKISEGNAGFLSIKHQDQSSGILYMLERKHQSDSRSKDLTVRFGRNALIRTFPHYALAEAARGFSRNAVQGMRFRDIDLSQGKIRQDVMDRLESGQEPFPYPSIQVIHGKPNGLFGK